MISLGQFQTILANNMFDGSLEIAGIVMFSVVMASIFAIFYRNLNVGILLALPVALIFRTLGVLSTEFTLLLIVVAVFTLALGAKKALGD